MDRLTRSAAAIAALMLMASAHAQIDSTVPYVEPSLSVPIPIAPTVPSWLRTGVGVALLGELRLEEYLNPVESGPVPAQIPLALSQ